MKIGNLVVTIGSDVGGLISGVAKAESVIEALSFSIARSARLMATWGVGIAGLVSGGGLFLLVKHSYDAIDATSKLASRLDTSVASLQNLQHAAALADVSAGGLSQSLSMMSQRLADAALKGIGPTYEALRRLHLSAKDLLDTPVDERLIKIAEAMEKAGYNSAQIANSMRQLGVRNKEMIELFSEGGKAIKDATGELTSFNAHLTDLQAKGIEEVNDQFTRLNRLVIQPAINALGNVLAPVIYNVTQNILTMAKEYGGFGKLTTEVTERAIFLIGEFAGKLFDAKRYIEDMVGGFDSWSTKMGKFISDPIGYLTTLAIEQGKVVLGLKEAEAATYDEGRAWDASRPSGDKFIAMLREQRKALDAVAGERGENKPKAPSEEDPLTEQKRKALEDQFRNLQKSIANEAEAMKVARTVELEKLAEFDKQKVGSDADRAAVRARIEEKFQQDVSNLRFSKLFQDVATEQDILLKQNNDKLRLIQEFETARTITEQEAADLRVKYNKKAAIDLALITARQYSTLASVVDTSMNQIKTIIDTSGGAAFQVMKGLAMATALVHGFAAVVAAYKAGWELGPVAGPVASVAFAAIAAAGVAAQIAAIARTQPGSTGGTAAPPAATGDAAAAASSGGGGGGGPNSGQTLYINGLNRGDLFSGDAVRDLSRAIIQYQRDGGKVMLNT